MPWKFASARWIAASGDIQFGGDRHRRQRIQHIVAARQIEGDARAAARPGAQRLVARLQARSLHIDRAHIRALAEAVGDERPADALQDALHMLIVRAQHGETVERQVVQEVDEALLETREIALVRARGDRCRYW